jgi:PST family polysaccharide transporter
MADDDRQSPQDPTSTSIRRPLAWSAAMSWGQRGLTSVFTFVIAALLGPHDFGIVAMALVFVNIVEGILEQGIGTALIQRRNLEDDHLHSAFWLNVAWSFVLIAGCIAISGPWAELMDEPELAEVIKVLSVTILMGGLAIVQLSLLARRLEFKKLALRANVAALCGGLTGITLAALGEGVWALVGQQLCTSFIALVLAWPLGRYVPRMRFSARHTKEILSFSAPVFLANMGGLVSRRADVLLMGVFFSSATVGIYRLADRFVDLVLEVTMQPVGAVALPHFSRLRFDPDALRAGVATCMRVAAVAVIPAMFVLAGSSDELLDVMGESWDGLATTISLLCIAGVVKAVALFTAPLLFALDHPRLRAAIVWGLAAVSAAAVVIAGSILEGSDLEDVLRGMAGSRALVYVLVFLPVSILVITRMAGLPFGRILRMLPGPILAGLVGFGVAEALEATGLLDALPAVASLILSAALSLLAVVAVLAVLEPEVRRAPAQLARALRSPTRAPGSRGMGGPAGGRDAADPGSFPG